jgi:hypothetical protein
LSLHSRVEAAVSQPNFYHCRINDIQSAGRSHHQGTGTGIPDGVGALVIKPLLLGKKGLTQHHAYQPVGHGHCKQKNQQPAPK